VSTPLLDQCYRALDAVADAKESTEEVLYARLCDLCSLDLRRKHSGPQQALA
jgi:hypothetical protein